MFGKFSEKIQTNSSKHCIGINIQESISDASIFNCLKGIVEELIKNFFPVKERQDSILLSSSLRFQVSAVIISSTQTSEKHSKCAMSLAKQSAAEANR